VRHLDKHKIVVDLACRAALGPVYDSTLFANIFQRTSAPQESQPRTIVFVICGGLKVNLADMLEYQADL
jgi:L-serine/L-threonine ammonia-lyase